MNHEVFAALGEALSRGEDAALVRRSCRPTAPRRSAWARRCWYSPTAESSGRSAADATNTTPSGKPSRSWRPAKRTRSNTTSTTISLKRPVLSAAGRWRCSSSRSKPRLRLHFRRRACRLLPGPHGPASRIRRPCRRRPSRVCQRGALPDRRIGRSGRHPAMVGAHDAAPIGLRRDRDARTPERPRRATGHRAARPSLRGIHRQPRQADPPV